jgi:hypothetical protein
LPSAKWIRSFWVLAFAVLVSVFLDVVLVMVNLNDFG